MTRRGKGRRWSPIVATTAAVLAAVPAHAAAQAPGEEDRGAPEFVVNTGYATWWGLWHLGTVEANLGLGGPNGRMQLTSQAFHGYRRATNVGCVIARLECKTWWSTTGVLGGLRWSMGDRFQPYFGLQAGVFTFEHSTGRSAGSMAGAVAGLQAWTSENTGVYVQAALFGAVGSDGIPIVSVGAGLSFRFDS